MHDLVHEILIDADGVVRVLAGNGLIGFAVHAGVVAHLAQIPNLLFLVGLPIDKGFDFRVVDVGDDHFGRTPRRAAGFDGAGVAVEPLKEAHHARGFAAGGELFVHAPQR